MTDKQKEVELAIETEMAARGRKVLNRNALSALFGAFSDPVGALGKVFLGRQDALDAEKMRVQVDIIIELLCRIDDALSTAHQSAKQSAVIVDGIFELNADGIDNAFGIHIEEGAGPVEFAMGTRSVVTARNTKNASALKIGGRGGEEK